MRLPTRLGTLLALLAGIGLVLGACSSSSREPTAVSLDEYFRSVQALHDAQERHSEALGQRFADQLSGDQTDLEEVLAAIEGILPEFLPEFRSVLSETREGLAEIAPPAAAQDTHADLIEAYDDFVALIDRGVEQLEDGQPPSEVLTALFLDRSGTELGQRFSTIADELAAIADTAGIEGFVGGGALVVGSTAPDPTTNGGSRVDGTPRPTGVREVGTSSPVGPGISVGEAVSSRLVGPLLVNGYVVIANGEMRLCQTLDQSQPPACGDPSLPLEGFEPDPGTLTEASGVAWTSNEVQVLGERVGERLVARGGERVDGGTAEPAAGIATWPAGTETGVEVVDRVVASAVAGDPAALALLVHYRAVPCVLPGDALEGQVQCAEDEAAGTPVEVMLGAHCEGFFLRPAQVEPWLEGVVAEGLGLHGAYVEAAARTAERTGGTERAYVAVLALRSDPTTTVNLIVDDGGLSAVFRSCGGPPLEVREGGLIPHGAEVLLAAPG